MKKREVIWLIIRLLGLYFLYSAITYCLASIGSFMIVLQEPKLNEKSFGVLLQQVVLTALYGFAANYLLKDGTLIFDILNREDPPHSLRNKFGESPDNSPGKQNL